jgi:hypothetical protein
MDYRHQIAVAACVSAWRRHKILRTLTYPGKRSDKIRRTGIVQVTEKKPFPVSGFSGGWNLALGSGKRRVRRKNWRFGRSRIWV